MLYVELIFKDVSTILGASGNHPQVIVSLSLFCFLRIMPGASVWTSAKLRIEGLLISHHHPNSFILSLHHLFLRFNVNLKRQEKKKGKEKSGETQR